MTRLRVAVADDEPLPRERLARLLQEAGCEVVTQLEDGLTLLAWLRTHPTVDALFLDVQMPGGTGIEVLAEIPDPPPVVFVTAHALHAVQAFETAAVDFLLKPVFPERLGKALDRIRAHAIPRRSGEEIKRLVALNLERVPIKVRGGYAFLPFRRVSHFEVDAQEVWVWVGGKRHLTEWSTLGEVESAFPEAALLRIQRHLLLRPEAVLSLRAHGKGRVLVTVDEGLELEVSRTATPELKALLGVG